MQLDGTRDTCHEWESGLPTWAFVANYLVLEITGIWIQVEEIRGRITILYSGLNIDAPLTMSWDKVHHEKLLLIDRALLPPTNHNFCGDFGGCNLWTWDIKKKMNTATDWWNRQSTIRHSSCGGVVDTMWMVRNIKQRKNLEPDFLVRHQWV